MQDGKIYGYNGPMTAFYCAVAARGTLMATEEGFVVSAGVRNTIVVHPDDAPALRPLPNWENTTGCCGPN
ncbi:hypothetical protein [Streptomyces sp. NPDC002088]|uniref:hypothetical protein n=1 Tax=Streptomyces sp. NPDC002088 TaxID=3154665 RepID=UPI00333345AA